MIGTRADACRYIWCLPLSSFSSSPSFINLPPQHRYTQSSSSQSFTGIVIPRKPPVVPSFPDPSVKVIFTSNDSSTTMCAYDTYHPHPHPRSRYELRLAMEEESRMLHEQAHLHRLAAQNVSRPSSLYSTTSTSSLYPSKSMIARPRSIPPGYLPSPSTYHQPSPPPRRPISPYHYQPCAQPPQSAVGAGVGDGYGSGSYIPFPSVQLQIHPGPMMERTPSPGASSNDFHSDGRWSSHSRRDSLQSMLPRVSRSRSSSFSPRPTTIPSFDPGERDFVPDPSSRLDWERIARIERDIYGLRKKLEDTEPVGAGVGGQHWVGVGEELRRLERDVEGFRMGVAGGGRGRRKSVRFE